MIYADTLAAYRAKLEANPAKGLIIGADSVAVLLDGHLCGAELKADGTIDTDSAFDFDQSAWSDERGCWDADKFASETRLYISAPVFVNLRK